MKRLVSLPKDMHESPLTRNYKTFEESVVWVWCGCRTSHPTAMLRVSVCSVTMIPLASIVQISTKFMSTKSCLRAFHANRAPTYSTVLRCCIKSEDYHSEYVHEMTLAICFVTSVKSHSGASTTKVTIETVLNICRELSNSPCRRNIS